MEVACENPANLERETKTTKIEIVTYPLFPLASSFNLTNTNSFKFKVGIFASKPALYFQSGLTDYDGNTDSIITHVCELNFT